MAIFWVFLARIAASRLSRPFESGSLEEECAALLPALLGQTGRPRPANQASHARKELDRGGEPNPRLGLLRATAPEDAHPIQPRYVGRRPVLEAAHCRASRWTTPRRPVVLGACRGAGHLRLVAAAPPSAVPGQALLSHSVQPPIWNKRPRGRCPQPCPRPAPPPLPLKLEQHP